MRRRDEGQPRPTVGGDAIDGQAMIIDRQPDQPRAGQVGEREGAALAGPLPDDPTPGA